MEFRCFNGVCNCDYCGSCHAEFNDQVSAEKRKVYNQALEDAENRFREWLKSEYGQVTRDDVLPIRAIRSLRK